MKHTLLTIRISAPCAAGRILMIAILLWGMGSLAAQNYTITTTGGALVITDNSNNGETIALSQSSSNIRFVVTPTSRTYSINGGAVTAFTTPADVALSGITSITVSAAGGDDIITVAAFTASLPSLTINGGAGNETINLNGDITFAAGANLDLDLQNDAGSPGTDAVILANSTNLLLSGSGAAKVKVSYYLAVNAGASIETVDGNLTAEANQQATPSSGDFDGVYVDGANSKLACSGTGAVSVVGKSGTSSTSFGVAVRNGGKISSNSGDIAVIGTGGASSATLNYGVWVTGTNSAISSASGNVNVTGTGGGSGGSNSNFGVVVQGASASITSSVGNVSVTGIVGVGASSIGIVTLSSGSITTTGGGDITLSATSMNLTSTVSASGSGSVTLRAPDNIQIDLGTTTNTIGGPLGLSDAELDLVTGGSIIIGHALAGNITVSAAITHPTSNISLISGGDIAISGGSFSTGTGTLLLDCGASPMAVKPTLSGTDVTASTLSFGSDLAIVINGTTVDVQYTQLNVAGTVNLTDVALVLSGSHVPVEGQTFLIVANDGTDAITGTFNGMLEGATIPNFLGSSLNATISYLGIGGGGGNDVLITVAAALPVEWVYFSGKKNAGGHLARMANSQRAKQRGF